MISTKSTRELVTMVSPRYVTATGAEKRRILDEFVATTGYHRKYALALLRHPAPRRARYTPALQRTLVRLWEIADRIGAKRFVPDCLI